MAKTTNSDIIINQLDENVHRWFAVYTKYKAEKYVAENLLKKGIHAYVPLMNKTKVYKSKVKHTLLPLINCYVFVKIVKSEYVTVLETEYVMKFLKQRKELIAIPDDEIIMLQRVVGEVVHAVPSIEVYGIGTPVEVVSGSLTGLKGKVIELKGKKEFLVSIDSIGYQMILGINPEFLKPMT